jgi:hypothetical protein
MVHFPLTTVTFAESLHFGFRFHLEVLEAWNCDGFCRFHPRCRSRSTIRPCDTTVRKWKGMS